MTSPASIAAFATVGIQPRHKGQRYDKSLFGCLITAMDNLHPRGLPPGSKVEQIGTSMGYQGYDITPSKCYLFKVTLRDGTEVPAYSFSPAGQNGYMICQDYSFKANKPKKGR